MLTKPLAAGEKRKARVQCPCFRSQQRSAGPRHGDRRVPPCRSEPKQTLSQKVLTALLVVHAWAASQHAASAVLCGRSSTSAAQLCRTVHMMKCCSCDTCTLQNVAAQLIRHYRPRAKQSALLTAAQGGDGVHAHITLPHPKPFLSLCSGLHIYTTHGTHKPLCPLQLLCPQHLPHTHTYLHRCFSTSAAAAATH